jgi:hypothetical protein
MGGPSSPLIPFLSQFVAFQAHRARLMGTRSMRSGREMRKIKGSIKCLSRHRNKTPTHLPGTVSTLSTKSPSSIHAQFQSFSIKNVKLQQQVSVFKVQISVFQGRETVIPRDK